MLQMYSINLTKIISFIKFQILSFVLPWKQISLQFCVCVCISEVRLYLMILEKLEHYEKALGVLDSNLAGKHSSLYGYIALDVV